MQPLWETLFRIVDDVKETVRAAAKSALKVLSRTTASFVRYHAIDDNDDDEDDNENVDDKSNAEKLSKTQSLQQRDVEHNQRACK